MALLKSPEAVDTAGSVPPPVAGGLMGVICLMGLMGVTGVVLVGARPTGSSLPPQPARRQTGSVCQCKREDDAT